MKYFEVEFENEYSIACKGERVPSIDEARRLCSAEVSLYGDVAVVKEIVYEEVVLFFDTDNIESWPVYR